MSAAAVMVMLPNIVMTLALQRYLVRGLTLGAVKGYAGATRRRSSGEDMEARNLGLAQGA